MYFSRLVLSRASKQVRTEIKQPYEMHRTFSKAFPVQEAGGMGKVRFRVEPLCNSADPTVEVLVMSDTQPNWGFLTALPRYLAEEPVVKIFEPWFLTGAILKFRLKANPSVKRYGKRYSAGDPEAWLRRKGEQHGFVLQTVQMVAETVDHSTIHRPGGSTHEIPIYSVLFEGTLRVVDPGRFNVTLLQGIGQGKACGLGLLSVA